MKARHNNLNIISRWMKDVLLAVVFLTRLPVKLGEDTESPKLAEVIWTFPVVGVFIGALASFVMLIGFQLGLDPLICGLLAVAAQALITGALHEDGLADVADGFGGGNKVVDKLRIMRDSCVGTYGVLALVFSVAIRASLIASMTTQTIAVLALIFIFALAYSTNKKVINV